MGEVPDQAARIAVRAASSPGGTSEIQRKIMAQCGPGPRATSGRVTLHRGSALTAGRLSTFRRLRDAAAF